MNLRNLVKSNFESLNDDWVICMKRPWTLDAESIVVPLDDSLAVPRRVKEEGFDYFLEISIAREVLEAVKDRPVTLEEKAKLLLYYAENDAYPDWAL